MRLERSTGLIHIDGVRSYTYPVGMDYDLRIAKLRDFYQKRGRMPSLAELAKLVGFKSKNAASKLVQKLAEQQILKKDRSGRLIPVRMLSRLKVLGVVEAGFPSPAEEELSDTMSMDEYLIENKEATFMLKVKGDSMLDAGIMPGDMVLVERGKQAKLGDIVIAEIDKGWTMKYLQKVNGRICLLPANKNYKPIYPEDELNISAVVTAVIRKY